jgi:hypothetical protein
MLNRSLPRLTARDVKASPSLPRPKGKDRARIERIGIFGMVLRASMARFKMAGVNKV